jgi:hypothetical protein
MSLKAFHVVFIAASLLLTLGFGVWGVRDHAATGNAMSLYLGVGSFIVSALLAVYGVWFLRKLRNISYV